MKEYFMKTMNLFFLVLCFFGFSIAGFSQVKEESSQNHATNKTFNSEYQNFKKLGVAIKIIDSWKMKKQDNQASIDFDNRENNSNFSIQLENYRMILNKIISNPEEPDKNKDNISTEKLIEQVNKITSEVDKKPDSTVSFIFSRTFSKQEGNKELITTYKTINNKGLVIKASIDKNCVNCKDQLNYMIESIKEYK